MRLIPFAVLVLALTAGAAQAQQQQSGPSIQGLHDALRLTPQQETAWRAYQSAIAPDQQQQFRAQQAQMMMPTLPTPRRLALMKAQMQTDLSNFDRDAQAVVAFYGQLSPEQQHTFDAQTAPTAQQR